MGVALMVPFTYAMDPSMALVYLAAIYLAANYGGAITAIMINTPGTPSAVVTSFDGHPLCVQGRAREALGLALVAQQAEPAKHVASAGLGKLWQILTYNLPLGGGFVAGFWLGWKRF